MVCAMDWIWGQRFASASSSRGIGPPNRAFPLCFPSHLLGLRHMGTSSPLPTLSFPVSMQNKRQAITLCQTCDWEGGRPLVFITAWLLSLFCKLSHIPWAYTNVDPKVYTYGEGGRKPQVQATWATQFFKKRALRRWPNFGPYYLSL